jgi:hypothetical protein
LVIIEASLRISQKSIHAEVSLNLNFPSFTGDLRENVISNAHKGCGPLDLSGMTAVSKNDGVTLFRPLLPLEKVRLLFCGYEPKPLFTLLIYALSASQRLPYSITHTRLEFHISKTLHHIGLQEESYATGCCPC